MVYYKKSGSTEVVLYFGDRLLKNRIFTAKSVGSRQAVGICPLLLLLQGSTAPAIKKGGKITEFVWRPYFYFSMFSKIILLTISFSGNTECLIWIHLLQTLDFYYWIVLKNLWKELCYFIKNDRLNFQNVTGKIVIGKNSRKFMRYDISFFILQ